MNGTLTERATGTCSYCGIRQGETHSARYECSACWDYRKLDRPAARHWAKVLLPLFSNIDFYDVTKFFPAATTSAAFLNDARRVLIRSKLLLLHGPEHTWPTTVHADLLTKDDADMLDSLITEADLESLKGI